jgi:hypothetical protein
MMLMMVMMEEEHFFHSVPDLRDNTHACTRTCLRDAGVDAT